MNGRDEDPKFVRGNNGLEVEPELSEAIGNFKSSLDAWSDNAMSRPREVTAPTSINWGRHNEMGTWLRCVRGHCFGRHLPKSRQQFNPQKLKPRA